MSFYTKNYNLTAFQWGEYYSSSKDRKRFTTIDNELAFISDQISEGVIEGWELIDNGDGSISVSKGVGVIGRRVVETLGELSFALNPDTSHHVYMKMKNSGIGGSSGFSNMVSIEAVDTLPPDSPLGISQIYSIVNYLASLNYYDSDLILYLKNIMNISEESDNFDITDYNQIAFKWDENTEVDFSHYIIRKAIDEYGTMKDLIVTDHTVYVDINLDQNTYYNYQIVAVDLSGNESDPLDFVFSTEIDERIPSDPIYVQAFSCDNKIQVIWDHSPSDNVSYYKVVLQALDESYNEFGPTYENIVEYSSLEILKSSYTIFSNIENNTLYRISVYAVSAASLYSEGISTVVRTVFSQGAGEIENISINFNVSSYENVGMETILKWNYSQDDPYLSYAYKFVITFVENGSRRSEPIEILESFSRSYECEDPDLTCYGISLKYIPYNNEGRIEYESIKEFTPYFIIIQTVDEYGNTSNGIVSRVSRTPVSSLVDSISNFSIERKNDNTIYMTWKNSTEEYFSHNLITINITDLSQTGDNPSDVDGLSIYDNYRIGKSESFVIPSSFFNINYRYDIEINSFDVFGTQGNGFETFEQLIGDTDIVYPDAPSNLNLSAGDTVVDLMWDYDYSANKDVVYFKIYRADFSFYLRSNSFVNIATIDSSKRKFSDYTVENNKSYSYFVNAVDLYGNESLNPDENNYFPSYVASVTPSQQGSLVSPSNLQIDSDSNVSDAYLSWDASSGTFDGYEILRSDGNNYSFKVVGYVSASQTSFVDGDALLINGYKYYYLIRKFSNDSILYVTTSNIPPSNSVFIGDVLTSYGLSIVSIDVSQVRDLADFEDPIRELTQEKINIHNHKIENGMDKRIELRSDVSIIDWSTYDYMSYYTSQDIEGASSYILRISGDLNEDYFKDSDGNIDLSLYQAALSGESPILYEVDGINGKIVFNDILYTLCEAPVNDSVVQYQCPLTPYSTEPILSLEMIGVSEVSNFLEENRVESLSATQIETGIISDSQMPIVNHEGRIGEKLIPLRLILGSYDNFVYNLTASYDEDRNNMGSSVTFYRIMEVGNEGGLLSATSNGLWYSDTDGGEWTQAFSMDLAPHILYKSEADNYYAATNFDIYKADGDSFRNWKKMEGLDSVKVIRDIVEDGEGNIYVSTDIGVYKLNKEGIPYIEDKWQQLSIFGPRSSEAYGLYYDKNYSDSNSTDGRILVSNDLGLLQSVDQGASWEYVPEMESGLKVWKFTEKDGCIFALSDNSIFRKSVTDDIFYKIAIMSTNKCRKMEIYNSKIYINSDKGPMVSNGDIYSDASVDMVPVWADININNQTIMVTSIDNIGGDLFVGTDRRLFIVKNGNINLQYEQKNKVVPTFFVDSTIQNIGFYYNNSDSQNVSFDDKIGVESIVEVSNKYDIYYAEHGGWVSNKYDSKVDIYKNRIYFGETKDSVSIPLNNFSDIVYPDYSETDSYKDKADEYKSMIEQNINKLLIDDTSGDELRNLVSNIYSGFELFLSQLYLSARYIENNSGDSVVFTLPSINTELIIKRETTNNQGEKINVEVPVYYDINTQRGTDYGTSVNVVNGQFVFDVPFDRYDLIEADIFDVTVKNKGEFSHREVEDSFEYAYSGLTSYLSQVQQINLVKLNLFIDKTWPQEREIVSPYIQSKYVLPSGDWFDTLNSTINYNEIFSYGTEGLSLNFPSAVAYIDGGNMIFVGGYGGVLSIDSDTLDISQVNIGNVGEQWIRDIFVDKNEVYVLSEKNIFYSSDYGFSWSNFSTIGLPNNIFVMGKINNNLIIGAEDGVYVKTQNNSLSWEIAYKSSSPVKIMLSSSLLFVVIDGKIYRSYNGYSFSDTGVGEDLTITSMTQQRYSYIYISSIQGLYTDNGTFNGVSPILERIKIGDIIDSSETVNNVYSDGDTVVIGISNGSYGVIEDSNVRIKEYTSLPSVHKILIVDEKIWVFGADRFKVSDIDYSIRLSESSPI